MSSCARCGMYVHDGPMMNDRFEVIEGPKLPHQCPRPMPYAKARALADMLIATGTPTSSRTKAAIKLGLELGPPPG